MKNTLNLRQFEILLFINKYNTKYVDEPQFAHHCYKPAWLTSISSYWSLSRSLHYLPRSLRSIVTCGKTPTTVTSSALRRFVAIVTQQTPIVEQFAPQFHNLPLQAKNLIKWTASSLLHVTKTVNLTLVQCECHIAKQTVIAKINPTNHN